MLKLRFYLVLKSNSVVFVDPFGAKMENRHYVCQINVSSLNTFLTKLEVNTPRPGRSLEQSPLRQFVVNVE